MSTNMMFPMAIISLLTITLQGQECMLQFNMLNNNRTIAGEVWRECGTEPDPPFFYHTPPWGNWGVDSNVGSRTNGDQFQGWHSSGGHRQWNSCTRESWESPDCNYYNSSGCTQQVSNTGTNNYGGGYLFLGSSCAWWDPFHDKWYGGCGDFDGFRYGPYGNYMKLYELDAGCCDDLVTTLHYNDNQVWAPLTCPDPWSCNSSTGSWISSSYDPVASAQIQVQIVGGWYIDHPLCGDWWW